MDGETHALISLYESLDQQPSSVHIHERLLEIWAGLGDEEMVSGTASALMQIDPNNRAARRYLRGRRARMPQETSSTQYPESRHSDTIQEDFVSAEKSLRDGYTSLKLEAKLLLDEIEAIHALGGISPDNEEVISNLRAISNGNVSTAIPIAQILPVREVARAIMAVPERCQELITNDFEAFIRWATCQNPVLDPDTIRERLVKRKALLEAALPESMRLFSAAALTHVEREHLQKKYVNSETMLGDSIDDIPPPNFFVSEDNYAWDMEELAQAIASNDGVMRNPLSRQMFSESDIRMLLAHPLGQRLRPLQMAQSELKRGVRPATIDRIEALGRVMLAVQGVDATPVREAMDEFQAYVATIPEPEQKTINALKIPARDGFSGQPFDYTVGESVRDAKANTTCFHKVGDFLSQAATYLRQQ